jgi:hypothetical protein
MTKEEDMQNKVLYQVSNMLRTAGLRLDARDGVLHIFAKDRLVADWFTPHDEGKVDDD